MIGIFVYEFALNCSRIWRNLTRIDHPWCIFSSWYEHLNLSCRVNNVHCDSSKPVPLNLFDTISFRCRGRYVFLHSRFAWQGVADALWELRLKVAGDRPTLVGNLLSKRPARHSDWWIDDDFPDVQGMCNALFGCASSSNDMLSAVWYLY